MSEASEQWYCEQIAEMLAALGSKFRYSGDEELSKRCNRAAEILEHGTEEEKPLELCLVCPHCGAVEDDTPTGSVCPNCGEEEKPARTDE